MNDELFYIQTKGYVGNCILFWRLKDQGYTCHLSDAQKYTREEAESRCRPGEDRMIPVSVVEGAASLMVDHQRLGAYNCAW